MENVGGNVTSTWTVSVDVSLSTCTSTAEVAEGNTIWPCIQLISIQLQNSIQCFVIWFKTFFLFVLFFASRHNVGEPYCPFQSNAVAALKQSHSKWGTLTKERHERGPINLLTTDFIPRVKGLFSVTFTWFKSLTQLNQKSMKSFGYIFGLSCQHFKLNTIFETCRATKQKKKKNGHSSARLKSDNSLKNITHSCYGSM